MSDQSTTRKVFSYMPILKWKGGESSALKELFPNDKAAMTPLVEIPPVPWDFVNDQAAKTVDAHLANVPDHMVKHWGINDDIFVDLHLVDASDRLTGSVHPVAWLFGETKKKQLKTIPVTSYGRDPAYQSAVASVIASDKQGVCIRLDNEDAFAGDLSQRIAGTLQQLATKPSEVDLVIDLGQLVSGEEYRVAAAVRGLLLTLPHVRDWRSLTCAGSAFPVNMSGLTAGVHTLPRTEWRCWKLLSSTRASLPRMPVYGDYAIAHPDLVELDPRIITMSANIRYTIDDEWLIFRGRSIEKHGAAQHIAFCKALVARPEYSGKAFSAGDAHIDKCANNGSAGPGNATTWRRVTTNHHLTFVVRQIAGTAQSVVASAPAP